MPLPWYGTCKRGLSDSARSFEERFCEFAYASLLEVGCCRLLAGVAADCARSGLVVLELVVLGNVLGFKGRVALGLDLQTVEPALRTGDPAGIDDHVVRGCKQGSKHHEDPAHLS